MSKSKKKTAASKVKADIINTLYRYKIDNRISDTELTKRCGCASKGTMSRVFKNGIECDSSLDKLLTWITTLGYDVEIQIKPKHEPQN